MNIYNAIMAAADFIEAHPNRFSYMACGIPRERGCGSPGCALGWIGAMAGFCDPHEAFGGISVVAGHRSHSAHDGEWAVERSLLGIDQVDFYDRMDQLDRDWKRAAEPCAAALRLYAEKYHSHEKPKAVEPPNWRAIMASPVIPEHVRSEEVA